VDPHDLALAYSLSTVAGLRASLTILAVTVAIHLHALAAPSSMAWLGSDQTLAIVALFAAADFLGDKIPIVDHALHLVHAALAPAAGGLAAASLDPNGGSSTALVTVLGAGNALGVHALRATTRAGSTVTSLGILNPVISFVEDLVAAVAIAVAFLAPFVSAAIAGIATVLAIVVGRKIARRLRRRPAPG
jgi:hypothetical protein